VREEFAARKPPLVPLNRCFLRCNDRKKDFLVNSCSNKLLYLLTTTTFKLFHLSLTFFPLSPFACDLRWIFLLMHVVMHGFFRVYPVVRKTTVFSISLVLIGSKPTFPQPYHPETPPKTEPFFGSDCYNPFPLVTCTSLHPCQQLRTQFSHYISVGFGRLQPGF